jgi:polysaccharide export outer membrane protein
LRTVTVKGAMALPRIVLLTLVICIAGALDGARSIAQESSVTRLMAGDRVNVTVFGQTNLSGSFQIDGEGSIELPLIGAVQVKQLTPKEAEKKIGDRLADGYLNRPVVSISVGEVRPVYVLGDVRSPAAYAFRPGSSVLSAIAQAGGYGAEVGGTLSDFLVADERVRVIEGTRQTLLIRMARLEAQRDEQASFTPPSFVAEAPPGKFAEAVKIENEALRYQQEVFAQELKLQREQKPRLEAARDSIEQQITSDKKQFDLVGEQLGDMEQLQSKGLSLRSREVSLRREQAALDSSMSRYRSELARLAVTLGELDIAIYTTQNNYKRRVLAELEEARRRAQEIENTLPTAKEVRDIRSQQVANASGIGQTAPTYRILLSRTIGDEIKTLTVTGETLLQPGDVVEVKRLRLEDSPRVVSSIDTPETGGSAAKTRGLTGEVLLQPAEMAEPKQANPETSSGLLSITGAPETGSSAAKLRSATRDALWQPGDVVEPKRPSVETDTGAPDAASSSVGIPPKPTRRGNLAKGTGAR